MWIYCVQKYFLWKKIDKRRDTWVWHEWKNGDMGGDVAKVKKLWSIAKNETRRKDITRARVADVAMQFVQNG